jgi:hypothetical protein
VVTESVMIWTGDASGELRGRLVAVEAQFADASTAAVGEAVALVADTVHALNRTLLDQALRLTDPVQQTEALQRYRTQLEKVLGL